MAGVTIHPPGDVPQQPRPRQAPETPTQQAVRQANALNYVTDETGRTIGWAKLDALADFDLCEIAAGNAGNQQWMMRATLAYSVREIDGDAVPRPNNKQQLRALVARLGDAGMVAVGQSVFGSGDPAEADMPDETERAKNFPDTPTSG